MKITKSQLKQLIKEELQEVVGPMSDREPIEGSGFSNAGYLLEDAERIYEDLKALSQTAEGGMRDESHYVVFKKIQKAKSLVNDVVSRLKNEERARGAR
jgi:hypothetical protein